MSRILILGVAAGAAALVLPVSATQTRNEAVVTVAMMYHMASDTRPKCSGWASRSNSYPAADPT